MVLRVAGLFAAFVLLPACHRHPRVDSAGFAEPDAAQQARALEAVAHLQAEFNTGNCQLVFEEASPHFRAQDPKEWRRECALMKDEMGAWRNFEVKFAQMWPDRQRLVCVVGLAVFERETEQVGAVWMLEDNGARLYLLMMRKHDGQAWTSIPRPLQRNPGPWIDPPPAKSPRSGVSL
jgi:hypothetical protein